MPERSINRLVLADVDLWLSSEHCGQRRLWVEIDCKYSVTVKGKKVSKVGGRGSFSAAAFEFHDRDDLKVFALSAVRKVPKGIAGLLLRQQVAKLVYLIKCVNLLSSRCGVGPLPSFESVRKVASGIEVNFETSWVMNRRSDLRASGGYICSRIV